jgi:diguanylate cyclase (GGDEF)-like protein/PAS domain S-box-containing protein
MMGLTVSPVVLGEALTAVVLAVALAVAGRRREDLDGRTLGLWLGGALILEAVAHLVLTWPDLTPIPYHFVFASLHGLAPVLILMAVLSARKAMAAASGLPLVLGVLVVISLGAMIETGVTLRWVDAAVHGMRALILAIVALLAWRRLPGRLGITVSVLTALMALVSAAAMVIAATTASAHGFEPLAHLLSWGLLVALALSALFAEIRGALAEPSTSVGARSASADHPAVSLAGPDADGTVGQHLGPAVGKPVVSDMAQLCLRMDDLMLGGSSSRGLAALVCQWVAQHDDAALVWVAIRDPFGTVTLQGAEGPAADPLRDLIDHPLPGDLADTLVSAAGLEGSQAGFDIEGAPPGVPMRLGGTGADRTAEPASPEGDGATHARAPADAWNAALSSANAALVFPFAGAQGRFCALVVHGGALALDRGARQHLSIIARRLASMAQLCHETGFLRLQSAAMSVAANAIFITDQDGRIAWANEAFTRLSGFSGDEVRGKTPHILFSGHQDPKTYSDLWSTLKRGDVWRGELVERRKDGTLYTVQQTVTPMRGPDGDAVYYVAVHEDISARKRAEERIRYMSNYDMLTRLPNRVLFRDRLHQAVALARRVKGSVSVLFLDLTQFSRVNDTLGHDIGDQILMTVGSRINAAVVDEVDTVARMGGDEFAIIQSGGNGAEAAASLAVRLARIVETPVEISGTSVSLRATVGIAMYPEDGADPDGLIKAADLAMHRVVRSEGEAYRFFSNEINDEAQVRLDLEADLRRALERGELLNYYQPQYDVTGTLVGMEALVRWLHPTRGLVPPGQFIAVAEDSGLIVPLGEEVLHRALADLATWRKDGLPLVPVAVNISAVQFRDSGLVTRLRDALERHDLPPSALDLELTESVLMGEHAGAVGFLTRLADAGFRIAIDDFGTGYSSLSYLKRFPVHKLKIDQSFVRHINEDRNDTILVSAIINLGHSLGMSVIAEGVETEAQFKHLRSVGIDVLQGYLLGRPMPEEQIRPLMTAPALVLPPPDAPPPITEGDGQGDRDGEAP